MQDLPSAGRIEPRRTNVCERCAVPSPSVAGAWRGDLSILGHLGGNISKAAAAFGMFTGVIAGNIGAGGAFMVTPLFWAILKMPIHRAIGASMPVSIFTAIASTSGKALMGQAPWVDAAIVVMGSALGTIVVARLTRGIPSGPLRWLLIGMLILLLARTAADLVG